jgi:2-C-methyl-D-erythritol 4-phosphate cytidylyltransferase/2-C-methyl-D-erythritol 2,4-cyclodiphosphate synthase
VATRQHPDFVGVIVAAGSATRFGGPAPKQFVDLGGRSVLERAVRAVADRPAVDGAIVVLAPEELDTPRAKQVRGWSGVLKVVPGGATRARSVMHGLAAVTEQPFVLIHDAARPMAGAALIDRVITATRVHGAALPALAVPDTVKEVDAAGTTIVRTVDRVSLRLAQTPQGARTDWLRAALVNAEASGAEVTDEAAALERAGRAVAVVAGDPWNRKITTAHDLEALRARVGEAGMGLRVGSGYDIHRFEEGRKLVLGGVHFEGEPGLAGHSDADVVLHAAMDALLGAAGLGDIGLHFPPDDSRYEGADSTTLARQVVDMVREGGLEIINVDLTLLAQRPRIRPRVGEMRQAIATCLRVDSSRVGLKATTLEGLGALGRGEGIACQALALLRERSESA